MNRFLKVDSDITLSKLNNLVGRTNADLILAANGLKRSVNIGRQLIDKQTAAKSRADVGIEDRISTLNSYLSSADIYEELATMSSDAWKVMKYTGTLMNMVAVPESVDLPGIPGMLGYSTEVITKTLHDKVVNAIRFSREHVADISLFNKLSRSVAVMNVGSSSKSADPFQWFKIPWGDMSLYSSISNQSVDFPVYPEEIQQNAQANYGEMPSILFQYEPWQTYESSGPRSEQYTFHMHRDMWSGDHRDGAANKLIRFCEANCYPDYNGSAVNTAIVTLFVKGVPLIRGVMTNQSVNWKGPIGSDGWYLEFDLSITIKEVSAIELNYHSVMNKPLIG